MREKSKLGTDKRGKGHERSVMRQKSVKKCAWDGI